VQHPSFNRQKITGGVRFGKLGNNGCVEKMRRHSRPFLYFAYKRGTTDMKHYESSDWNFALDIPRRWNSFPPVPTNSPNEVIRFASREDGNHLLIIFRQPHDPK